MKDITSVDSGNLDCGLVGKVLASEKEPLLLDRDTLTLHELLLDGTDGHIWLDIDGVLPAGNGVNIDDHFGNELTVVKISVAYLAGTFCLNLD